MCIKMKLRAFKQNQDGNFSLMAAIAVFILVLIVSLANDTSAKVQKRNKLQSVSDAIALAAYQSGETTPDKLQEIADQFLRLNYPDDIVAKIQLDNIERVDDEVLVRLSQSASGPDMFLPRSGDRVGVLSAAGNASENINIALVLDATGSMAEDGKMVTLRNAAGNLITRISDFPNSNARMSVVPFSQYVNVGDHYSGADWINFPHMADKVTWQGCVGSRLGGLNYKAEFDNHEIPAFTILEGGRDSCVEENLLPLTQDLEAARRKVNNITPRGFTYLPAGLAWGWRTLNKQVPFTQAATSLDPNATTKNIMIFMTDGRNTVVKDGLDHVIGGPRRRANATTAEMCDAIKNDEVVVYTIAFRVDHAPTRDLLEGCATNSAHYFDASNNAALIDAFDEIANELGNLRLTN